MTTYAMQPLGCDPQHIKGMSERLIVSHYENNYGGAVKRLNLITEQLATLDFANAAGYLVNGLKRATPPLSRQSHAPEHQDRHNRGSKQHHRPSVGV